MARQQRLRRLSEFLDLCEPVFDLPMCGYIGLPGDLPAQAGVLQGFLDGVLDDVEAKLCVFEVLVMCALLERLDLLAQLLNRCFGLLKFVVRGCHGDLPPRQGCSPLSSHHSVRLCEAGVCSVAFSGAPRGALTGSVGAWAPRRE
jgi:hypothetical protein